MKPSVKFAILLLVVLVCGVFVLGLSDQQSTSQAKQIMAVRLFSGGSCVAQWDSVSKYWKDENTLVFFYGQNNYQVRISGTYSIEETNKPIR